MTVAVVTGASRGIGHAVARRLSDGGYRVVGLSRTPTDLGSTPVDVTDEAEVREAFARIKTEVGLPSVLVNCAGVARPQWLATINRQAFVEQFDTNVWGTVVCCREFVKVASANWFNGPHARIVNVTSTAATRPSPGWALYAASKAAVDSFTLTLAEERSRDRLSVFAVAPGRCATDLRKTLAPDEDPATIMQPDEVAETVFALVDSGWSTLVSGQSIRVRRQL